MAIITIVGAGMMGSAMCTPAADNGHEVRLVGTPLDREIIAEAQKTGYHKTLKRQLPEGVKCYQVEQINEALDGAELLIGGVSSFGVEWFAENVLPSVPKSLPILSITKGLHKKSDGTLEAFPDYIAGKSGCEKLSLNAVGGPCISFELADRHSTSVAFCGHNINDVKKIRDMLSTDYYHITATSDVAGIETAVAMKNAYALGVSLAIGKAEAADGIGCKEHYNPQAALFTQSAKEMLRLIEMNGGNRENIIFGAGDLYVTVFGGRTRMVGTLLGRGLSFKEAKAELKGVTLESVAIAQVVYQSLKERNADPGKFPLLEHIYKLVTDSAVSDIPWDKF